MNTWMAVLEAATDVWQQAIFQVNWHHLLVAGLYLAVAWLCLLHSHRVTATQAPYSVWWTAAVMLLLLAANTVLQLDLWVAQVLRETARVQGWYDERRLLQYPLLALLLWGLGGFGQRMHRGLMVCGVSQVPTTLGLIALLLLALLRAVSAHHTDAVLNLHLAGLSIGRGLEVTALGLVVWGAWGGLRVR